MSPWKYYQTKNLQAIGTGDVDQIGESDRIYLFRYLWPVFDPEDRIRQLIERQYTLSDVKEFNGIEWQLFKRISKKS